MRFLVALFALLASVLTPTWAENAPFPPSPKQLVAVNPVTNKVYVANESANTVTVLDRTNNTTTTIPVGSRPQFIVVNPLTNRIYVNNGGAASMTVIDGATDTNLTPTPLPTGTQGPMAVNNENNVVYQVRMTSVATDEVTFFNANNNTWYTIATESFQPTALTINPVTNTLYVAHYGTGDVRVISGAYNNTSLHPQTLSIPAWSKPFAIAANSVTNKIYVITEDARGPIGVIDGATNVATWLTPAGGHASGPKALAVNPVINKIYAAFANEVVVIDGGNNSLTYVPVPTGSVASIAIDYFTNQVYVSNDAGNLTVINGFTNATTALTVPAGTLSIGANPMTGEIIAGGATATAVEGSTATYIAVTPTTSINPLPGGSAPSSGSITMSASNGSPNPLPIRGVYYQFDSMDGRWALASGAGNGPWTAPLSGLPPGSHTIYAFAAEAHMAPLDTGNGSSPMFGSPTSYAFSVTAASAATVGVASSVNPSTVGQSVTFTASVTSSSGTPTGTVTFLDGSTPLCSAVAIASGSAACTTTVLTAGSHTINANYSGDSTFGAASGSVAQTVNKLSSSVTLTSTPNPSTSGQSVTITATITGSGSAPTGTVTFLDGTTTLCSAVALTSGAATCTTSSLSTGAHTLNANYSGNGTYNAASGTTSQNVGTATATVGVTSSANPSSVGQSVTFTATVGGSSGSPTGSVTFTDGATTLCSAVALSSGTAACTTSSLAAGSHTITAAYSGSTTYGAKSATVTQTVNKIAASVSLGSTPNPSTSGQSVTITATVTGSGSAPTGTVTFTDGATTLCSAVTVASGAATCTTSTLSTGAHTLNASYSGNATYNTATGTSTHNVGLAASTVAVTSSMNPSTVGQSVTFTAALGGSSGTPTGTVTFSDGATTLCPSVTVAGGSAACTTSSLAAGSHTITATYSGNSTYATKSATVTQTVNAAATGTPATISSPANGATLGGASQTFTWNAAPGATLYQVWVGNAPGAHDIGYYPRAGTTSTSTTVDGLPTDGRTLYVRLWSLIDNVYYSTDSTYVAASGPAIGPARITSPANGATLGGASQTFTWNAAPGATLYQVWVGNAPGAYDIGYYPRAGTPSTSTTVDGLPTDGRTLYVRLWSMIDGVYYSTDSTYTAATVPVVGPARITSPANGAVLSGASQLFRWNAAAGATLYQVWVGNAPGAYDIGYYPRAGTTSTSTTVDGLPTDGRTLYVRLWSLIDGVYQFLDFTYTAASSASAAPSSITSPVNGATLAGATQRFEWNDAGATSFQLWIGNTPGAHDIGYFPPAGTSDHSVTVTGLPTDGRTLYVTLYSVVDGAYQSRAFTYVAARAAP